ncbi:MAG: hypothetical protein PHV55_09675, partial [Candidatus Omnitrophica bacterium]|nr:hypothetical protein [Candidatus Omnitrophota bacterium]
MNAWAILLSGRSLSLAPVYRLNSLSLWLRNLTRSAAGLNFTTNVVKFKEVRRMMKRREEEKVLDVNAAMQGSLV